MKMIDCREAAGRALRRGGPALFSLFLLSLITPARQAGPLTGAEIGQATTVVVVVPGNAAWTDTGLEVQAGEAVSFEAAGKITLQRGNPEAECGPDGYDLQTLQQPMSGRNLGALIGKVVIGITVIVNEKTKEETPQETAEMFYIGSKNSLEMPAKGRLYLGINENVIGDNGGEFRVTVSATPGTGPAPAPGRGPSTSSAR